MPEFGRKFGNFRSDIQERATNGTKLTNFIEGSTSTSSGIVWHEVEKAHRKIGESSAGRSRFKGTSAMNRFFTKQQAVAEYHIPDRLQVELFRAVQPVEQDQHCEPLYLENHLDHWLVDRFGAGPTPASANEPFMTIRETAAFLRCSYCEARERLLDGRIRAIRGGRWLRTRREWIEEYIAEKTIKAARDEPGVYTVPNPRRRRQVNIKFKKGSIGEQFLREREEAAKKNKGQ